MSPVAERPARPTAEPTFADVNRDVLRTLERAQWNVSRAARQLGVHRNTVLVKLATWGVHRPGAPEGRSATS